MCDPANEDCRDVLIDHIRKETVRLDVAFWFMEDSWMAQEVINRWKAGVPVRVLMDTEANSPNPKNATRLAELEAAGIPMRERTTSGILHWKMMLFAGQGIVEFSGANYSSEAWTMMAPQPYKNYIDEVILFTSDESIVNSFKTMYDNLWTNTNAYTNYRNISGPLTRAYATYPIDPRMNYVPNESYYWRARDEYRREPSALDVIMYRITDYRFTDEMIQAKQRGVRVRLMTEPQQYRDSRRLWHSYNVDLLYMAGVEIKHRVHAGLNHQKSVLMRGLNKVSLGSSNWSEASADYQEEHNLFTTDPVIYGWLVDQFERKWNGLGGIAEYGPFVPLAPDAPKAPSPVPQATGVDTTGVTLTWDGSMWAHRYDVYFGTNPNALPMVASNLSLGPSQWEGDLKAHSIAGPLQPGTVYYWKIVGRTMANMTAESPVWSFTTAGVAGPPPPPPPPPTVTLTREPYLQQVTPTSGTIVWATRESGTAQVRVSGPTGTTTVAAASSLVSATATGFAADYYQHVARVDGLAPATTYQYDILVNGADLNGTDTLKTAPTRGTGTVRFVAIGDSGTGSPEQRQIGAMIGGETFDFALHGGDIAYGNSGGTGGATYQTMDDWFFSVYASWLRSKPMFPSMGNHDSRASNGDGRPYLDLYVLPTNGASPAFPDHAERYYSFDYGPVHVVVLDTELAFQDLTRRAAQLAWLDADLSSTTQPWKVALFHRSPYSTGGEHGSDLTVRQAFGDVFDRHGVQLAISAHEHDYERTHPMKAGAPTAGGTTYIVTGGGGAPLYPAASSDWTAFSASVHHYLKGVADECTLRVDAVAISGGLLDGVELTRCASPPPPPPPPPPPSLPAPWQTQDIGAVGPTGSASATDGTFSIRGAGADIWNTADAFRYVWQQVSGDVDIVARVTSIENVHAWVKAAVMIREQLTPESPHGMMLVSPGKGLAFQRRLATSGISTSTSGGAGTAPNWVKLERRGNLISAYRSADGVSWTLVGSDMFTMGPNVYVGLAVSSHDASRTALATFDNVSISTAVEPPPPPPNTPPSVALTSPANGASFTAPASIGLAASASDSDGTITGVEFFANGTLVGADASAPFAFTWANVPSGTYTLTARATDNAGATATSAAVTVTVTGPAPPPNAPPTVSLTSPANGASFTAPATIDLAASASDSDGTVTQVAFYANGTLLTTDTASPYAFTWSNVPAGSYTLTARARDNTGAETASSGISVTVTDAPPPPPPPPPALPTPWQSQDIGAVGAAGSASATSGTFTVRGAGADIWNSADAFHYVWQPISGDATIVARVATVENVNHWVKAAVMIREHLTPESAHGMMLVSPGKGLAFQRRTTTSGSSVSTSGGAGTAPNWVKLERRGNTITAFRSADGAAWTLVGSDTFAMGANVHVGLAVSSHIYGQPATATFDNVSVTASSTPPPPPPPPANVAPTVTLTSPVNGATYEAPATITLAASASDGDGSIARVDFYMGGTLLESDVSSPYQSVLSDVPPGTYTFTARAFDNAGAATTSSAVTVTVTTPPPSPAAGVPAPWTSQDIGAVGAAGSATESGGTFTLKGAGADIYYYSDAFHFVWQPIAGDVDIVARVTSIENVNHWVKAAVMVREHLTHDSAHAMMLVSPGKGLAFQRRVASGGASTNTGGIAGTAPMWVKLERRGNTITAYRSIDGLAWTLVGSDTFAMGTNVHVGLALSSHIQGQLATATFDNVSVTRR